MLTAERAGHYWDKGTFVLILYFFSYSRSSFCFFSSCF